MKKLLLFVGLLSATLTPALARETPCEALANKHPGTAHTVQVDGHPLAVYAKSPANPRATILLVHGRTWSGRPDFDLSVTTPGACEDLSLMNGLVDAGIAAYAVDMRGYGQTPRDASGWLTPTRAATDIVGVMRWLNSQILVGHPHALSSKPPAEPDKPRAHLFGWSYGATMAQLAAQQDPELAASLTLFGYAMRKGYSTTPATLPDTPPAKPNTHANAISDFIVPNSISAAAIEAFANSALAADPVRADWRQLEEWHGLNPRKVQVPVLLLQGEYDPLTRKRAHRRLFRRLPNRDKQWVVIKGGDHAAFMESPRAEFLEHLTRFVYQHN